MARVWVKPHTRNGKKTKGHWRETSSSGSVVSKPVGKRRAKRIKDTGKMSAGHVLTPAQMSVAKLKGSILHSSGKAVYYDKKAKDFYVTTSWGKKNTSLVVDSKTGTGRVYFKKNKREHVHPLFD